MKKSRVVRNIIYFSVLTILVLTFVFVIVRLAMAPSTLNPDKPYVKIKSDYSLILVMTILGIIGLLVPTIADKKFRVVIPNGLEILYICFLFGAVYLGEVRYFYYRISFWDDILHGMSSGMFAIGAFSVVNLINKKGFVDLNPAFVALFAFCFALAIGAVWEIMEFTMDKLAGMNAQKWATETGEALIGRSALEDTMNDIIVDTIGAATVSFIGYLSLKGNKSLISRFLIKGKEIELDEFLEENEFIDYSDKKINDLASDLFKDVTDKKEITRIAYEYVRDKITHIFDSNEELMIGYKASMVLENKCGICHSKALLLAALLRLKGIPCGFCFQRLTLADDNSKGYMLHCYNAVYLDFYWIYLDARGNKEGIEAKFSLHRKRLAYKPRKEYGECSYNGIYADPDHSTINMLMFSKNKEDIINNIPQVLHVEPNNRK